MVTVTDGLTSTMGAGSDGGRGKAGMTSPVSGEPVTSSPTLELSQPLSSRPLNIRPARIHLTTGRGRRKRGVFVPGDRKHDSFLNSRSLTFITRVPSINGDTCTQTIVDAGT